MSVIDYEIIIYSFILVGVIIFLLVKVDKKFR